MWSDTTAMPEKRADVTPLRRGQVWLTDAASPREQCVAVIAAETGDGTAAIVAPVGHGVAPGRGRVALPRTTGLGDGAVVRVGRLRAMHRGDLFTMVTMLPDDRMREIDTVLRDVLGLGVGESGVAAPAPGPLALPPPPVPLSPPQQVQEWEPASEATRLEDHPMARLFGQTPRAVPAPAVSALPDTGPAEHRAASPDRAPPHATSPPGGGALPRTPPAAAGRITDALPVLLEVVRRRLHRSSPHLEGMIVNAVNDGRSIEWTAAAVRRASIRGVMQSTLDDIAAELESVAARGQAPV